MQTPLLINLGNQLTKIRESTELTAVEFFKKYLSGTERGRKLKSDKAMGNFMSAIENGKKQISFEMLLKYSEIGSVSVDYLLSGEEFTPKKSVEKPQRITLAYALRNLFTFCDIYTRAELANAEDFKPKSDKDEELSLLIPQDFLNISLKEEPIELENKVGLSVQDDPLRSITSFLKEQHRLTISFTPKGRSAEKGSYLYATLREIFKEWEAVRSADRATTAISFENLWRQSVLSKGENYTIGGFMFGEPETDDPLNGLSNCMPELDKIHKAQLSNHFNMRDYDVNGEPKLPFQ